MKKSVWFSFLALPLLLSNLVLPAMAAEIPLLPNLKAHSFDKAILDALAFEKGNIVYWNELGSVTQQERYATDTYEDIGCNPFYVMRDGNIQESGYDCRLFFCVGYRKGPKVCRDRSNKPYGGVVEVNNRLSAPPTPPEKKYFTAFAVADQTPAMLKRIADLTAIGCHPFYNITFKVAVGEGYDCDEIGKYPRYAAPLSCWDDWRDPKGMVCSTPLRSNEAELRASILTYWKGSGSSASFSSRPVRNRRTALLSKTQSSSVSSARSFPRTSSSALAR